MRLINKMLRNFSLGFLLVFNIFFVIVSILGIITLTAYIGCSLGRFDFEVFKRPETGLIIIFAVSIVLTTSLVEMIHGIFIKHIEKMIDAMNEVGHGNCTYKLDMQGHYIPAELMNYPKSFNKTQDKLNNTEVLQADFINNFSHELKTPITSINGFAQIIKDSNLTNEQRSEYVQVIIDESKRLSNLSTSILELSKLENEMIIDKKQIYISQLLLKVVKVIEPDEAKRSRFTINTTTILDCVNQELFMQMFLNIVSNSVKYSDNNSQITIANYQDEQYNYITVEDFGIGMSPDTITNVFNKFYQANIQTNTVGMGLDYLL